MDEENVNHLLIHCTVARVLWGIVLGLVGAQWVFPESVKEWRGVSLPYRFPGVDSLQLRVLPTPMLHDARPSVPASQTATEAAELAMAVGASIQSAAVDQPVLLSSTRPGSEASSTNGWGNPVDNASHGGWSLDGTPTHLASSSSGWADESKRGELNGLAPSAPPIPEALTEGPVYYPPIDLSPVDLSVPAAEYDAAGTSKTKDKGDSSSCVICWEAPIEGACIPCGHMAGCMTCLNEIKAKKGVCPVCRAKIQQVIKLYAV
ncbi:putative E3 ubiquitin-protein ligase XBOS34 [Vitis vinifera]|uniref:Putative E3 ubiquitin-protein ligase XBOS34 n=1 Tax=Vitis vinifera TaxID=29760 RepID=A0A438EGP1_VITVI|nr:putative E3 ubiquitin-protein ligase XBOS34 [Vitis vinifera]